MDNLGDWLYIIIIAIAAISSMFSSAKKKKKPTEVLGQPGHDHEPDAEPRKGFWEMLEELQQEEKNPIPEPVPQPIIIAEKKPETHKPKVKKKENAFQQTKFASHSYKENPGTTGRASYTDRKPMHIETEVDHYMFEDESFNDLTELRKAIIYTEILNRKY